MLLLKTDKARQELAPGMRTLSLRERSLLLLAEGKPLAELQAMYSGGGAEIVEHLLSQGYLSLSAPKGYLFSSSDVRIAGWKPRC